MFNIQDKLREIVQLKEKRLYEDALDKCDIYIEETKEKLYFIREKADILHLLGDIHLALEYSIKLELLCSEEPSDYYDLTRRGLTIGENDRVIKWADIGIAHCHKFRNTYYLQSLHFHKACAQINLNLYDKAIESLIGIEDEYSVYLQDQGVKTKADLIKHCNHNLKRKQTIYKFD